MKHPWPCSPFVEVHAERPRPPRRPSPLRHLALWLALRHATTLLAEATREAHRHDEASLLALREGDPDGAARYAAAADRADHEVGRWRARQGELEREMRG